MLLIAALFSTESDARAWLFKHQARIKASLKSTEIQIGRIRSNPELTFAEQQKQLKVFHEMMDDELATLKRIEDRLALWESGSLRAPQFKAIQNGRSLNMGL